LTGFDEFCGNNPSAAGLAFIAQISAELTCKCRRERFVSHDLRFPQFVLYEARLINFHMEESMSRNSESQPSRYPLLESLLEQKSLPLEGIYKYQDAAEIFDASVRNAGERDTKALPRQTQYPRSRWIVPRRPW